MKLLPALLASIQLTEGQKATKECVFTPWSSWSACSRLCGGNGTKERNRQIRLPRNGQPCLSNGLEPILAEVEGCNRSCLNEGRMTKNGCLCKPAFTGECCQVASNASTDRCDKRIRKPDGGNLRCGRAKVAAGGDEATMPWNWSCMPKCPTGKGMYRAHGDMYLCNSEGWTQQSLQQRSFDFEDYDDSTPTLPIADCAERKLVMGCHDSMSLVYVTTMEPAVLESMVNSEEQNAAVPQSLLDTVNAVCAKSTSGNALRFAAKYTVSMGNTLDAKRRKVRRKRDENATDEIDLQSFSASNPELMVHDVGLVDLPETEVAETDGDSGRSAIAGIPFTVDIDLSFHIKQIKHTTFETQELTRQLLRDCVGSILTQFESEMSTDEALESAGMTVASQYQAADDMTHENWPAWDRAGSECAAGAVLVGGTVMNPVECQSCPRGTVYLSKQRGAVEICRPCPSGTWMDREGAIGNDAGELGMCNACPSPAFMTNTFPAYSKSACQKTSCFPNKTKFQVVFALDSSGSVTRPDYIRMREFAKSIVNRMCINNSQESGSKTCGQASYVIYNQSAESYLKFKQVESAADFNKIDNYEYRGGPPRIGDVLEFIHDTFIDTTQFKGGIPFNIVLISDGQTQNDDKEHMEKWATKLKTKATKIITLSKRSMYNGNTLQLATSLDDQYFMNDYHELPNYVFPVMEQLCESVTQHKENRRT